MELKNRVAVVAGASQGIGEEIARVFSREGAIVVLLARRRESLDAIARDICSKGGIAHSHPMDVADAGAWNGLRERMSGLGLGCDVLVNNAYWRTLQPIGEVSDDDWQHTLDVSLKAYFLGSRAMLPLMLAGGRGSIINISSLQGRLPEPGFGAYAVAKGGVEALTRVWARDYGPRIRANTIVSGAVDTPGFAEGDEVKKALGARLPLGRIGFAGEIADVAVFLASDRSSFLTGADIVADGGRSLT